MRLRSANVRSNVANMTNRRAAQAYAPTAKTPGHIASTTPALPTAQATVRDVVLAGGLSRLTVKEMFQ